MSTAALADVLKRVSAVRSRVAGGDASSVSSDLTLEQLTSRLEQEADLLVASAASSSIDVPALQGAVKRIEAALSTALNQNLSSNTPANAEALTARLEYLTSLLPGGAPACLSTTVTRIESSLRNILQRDVGSTPAGLSDAQLADRLEQLVALLPSSGQVAPAIAPAPVAAAAAPAPVAAPAPAAAAAAVVDDSAAKAAAAATAEAEKKKAAEAEAARKAAADKAAADKAAADKAAAEKAAASKAAADKAVADKVAADKAAAEKAAAEKKAAEERAKKEAEEIARAKASDVKPAAAVAPASSAAAAAPAASSGGKTFSLAELKAGTPVGVEPSKKEQYLSDADFKATFNMERAAFQGLAGWKQADLKKKAGIF